MTLARQPRLLFITPLPPPVHGSAAVSCQIKNSVFIQEHFECDFVNLSTSRSMDEIGKKNIAKIPRWFASFNKTLFLLIRNQYDMCYIAIACHGKAFLKDAPFALLCKLFSNRLVIHQHNKGMSKDVDRWPYSWMLPLVYKNTKVILLSWHLYPDISSVVRKENVLICKNGIQGCGDKNYHHASQLPQLLFLSNLIPSKGVLDILDALEILHERGHSFICSFVGAPTSEISESEFESAIIVRNLLDCVEYHGPKYGDDKEKFWRMADVFVFPTFNDSFPLVLLEAMQHSIPIITTNEGGIPDIVQDGVNGLICRKNDPSDLAENISVLLVDKELRRSMGVKGYEIYKEKFTLEKWEQNFVDCLTASLA